MAVSANKFNNWVAYLTNCIASNPITWTTTGDTVKCMLSTVAPVATNSVYSDLTDLTTTGGYTAGGATCTIGSNASNSSGTQSFPLTLGNPTWTASGSGFSLRYVTFYDSTPTNKPLIVWYDYGSTLTLSGANGDTFTVSLSTANLFTVT